MPMPQLIDIMRESAFYPGTRSTVAEGVWLVRRSNGVEIAVSGDSQTIVCAAKPRKTQNQRLALCEILLPNLGQTQQV